MKPQKSYQQQTWGPLGDLTLEASAYQMVAKRFDFGYDSAVCQHLVQRCFAALEDEERRRGIVRLPPFTLHLQQRGLSQAVSLLDKEIVSQLTGAVPLSQVLRARREKTFKELLKRDPSSTMDELRRVLAPSELLAANGRRPRPRLRLEDVEQCRMDLAKLRHILSVPDLLAPADSTLTEVPRAVLAQLSPAIEQEGRSPEMARALLRQLLVLRERFCPPFEELLPGQLMAIALDLRDRRMSRKTRYRAHVPVRLTLYHEAELATLERVGPRDRNAVDEVLAMRVARLLTEAYCQGGLLSLTLLALLTHQSPGRVGRLVERFEAQHGLILPTPGSIHDAGTKLTHKATVIRMYLSGMECTRIARETFHSEVAVDRYINDFERTLIAVGHQIPSHLLPRVLKLGRHVVKQYEALIEEEIGGQDQLLQLLDSRGIGLDEKDVA